MDMPRQFPRRVRLRVKNQMDEQRFLFHLDGAIRLFNLGPITPAPQCVYSVRSDEVFAEHKALKVSIDA